MWEEVATPYVNKVYGMMADYFSGVTSKKIESESGEGEEISGIHAQFYCCDDHRFC